jgi:hypothetical protein
MPKKRFPDALVATITSIIRAEAYRLRQFKKNTGDDPSFSNSELVTKIRDQVHSLFAPHYLLLTEHYLSTHVSAVLEGNSSERRLSEVQILPGLDLPEWLAIPSEEGDRWKIPSDCTPSELVRLENRRAARIAQEQTELGKIRIVRRTAEARGCGPDDPISTVFDDGNGPKPPPLHPPI